MSLSQWKSNIFMTFITIWYTEIIYIILYWHAWTEIIKKTVRIFVTIFTAVSEKTVDVDFHRKKNILLLNKCHLIKIWEKMKQSKSRKAD